LNGKTIREDSKTGIRFKLEPTGAGEHGASASDDITELGGLEKYLGTRLEVFCRAEKENAARYLGKGQTCVSISEMDAL